MQVTAKGITEDMQNYKLDVGTLPDYENCMGAGFNQALERAVNFNFYKDQALQPINTELWVANLICWLGPTILAIFTIHTIVVKKRMQ